MLTDAMGVGLTNGTIRFMENEDFFTILIQALAGKLTTPTELGEQDISDRNTFADMRRSTISHEAAATIEQQQTAAQINRAKHSVAMENGLGGIVSAKS
jgi:hypothetical protein